ncbi:MAG: hypothetical protein WCC95_19190 [Candidatus Sulfotelmatobacter sp.]
MLPAFGNPNDLTEIDERLAQAPDDVALLFSRACTLDMLGRNNEAHDAYIEVIRRDGAHIGALGNLGTLLYNAGYRSAARLTYGEALRHHPRDLRTLINLGNALLENDELPLSRDLDAVSLLLLALAFRGNAPVEVPLDDQTFLTIKLFTDYYEALCRRRAM